MMVLKRKNSVRFDCHVMSLIQMRYKNKNTYTPLLLLLKLSKLTLHVVLLHRYGFSLYNVMPATVQFNICWSIIGVYLEWAIKMEVEKVLENILCWNVQFWAFWMYDNFNKSWSINGCVCCNSFGMDWMKFWLINLKKYFWTSNWISSTFSASAIWHPSNHIRKQFVK